MRADLPPQAGDFLRQDDAELTDQATQPVVGCRAFFDKSLPRAVQAEDDLIEPLRSGLSSQKTRAKPLRMLVFFLDRDETHMVPGDSFTDGRCVRRVILATLTAHAVGRHELGSH